MIMDGYVHDPSVFSKEKVENLFFELTNAVSMKMLDKPVVYEVPVDPSILKKCIETGVFEDEGGITGIVVISTSHMSIHCWPLQSFFSLDVFSCKDFDADKIVSVIRESLVVTSDNTKILSRRRPECLLPMTEST